MLKKGQEIKKLEKDFTGLLDLVKFRFVKVHRKRKGERDKRAKI